MSLELNYKNLMLNRAHIKNATKGLSISYPRSKGKKQVKRRNTTGQKPKLKLKSTPLSLYQITEDRLPRMCTVPIITSVELYEKAESNLAESGLFHEFYEIKNKKCDFPSNLSIGNHSPEVVDPEYLLN